MPPTLEYQHTPLPMIHGVQVRALYDHETLGMILGYLPDRDIVYIKDITPITHCSKIKGCKINLGGIKFYK